MRVAFLLAILVSLTGCSMFRAHSAGGLTSCKSNLKNIGTALEMYMTDFETYPNRLEQLTPNYLKTVPTCPRAYKDSYTAGYEMALRPTDRGVATRCWCASDECKKRLEALRAGKSAEKFCPVNKSAYVFAESTSVYTVVCTGANHGDAGIQARNYPQYTSAEGLIERP